MKKRIILVATSLINFDRRMRRIARTLENNNYQVKIISRSLNDNSLELPKFVIHRNVSTLFKRGLLFYTEINIRLFFVLLFSKFDGIYAVDLDTLLPSFIHAKIRNKKLIFDSHEFFTEVPELIDQPIKKWIWTRIGKICIPYSHLNITVSEPLSASLNKKYNSHFLVVKNLPAWYQKTVHKAPTKPTTLIYLGVLNEGRGLKQLLEVVRLESNLRLILIGKGDLYSSLIELSDYVGISDRVEFKGWVTPKNIMTELVKGDIAINILNPDSDSYKHSLANKSFDYIQAELPSIQMNFDSYHNLNQQFNTSILIDNLDVNEIISAINKLRKDPLLYNTLVDNCKKAKLIWNWQNEQEVLIQPINSIMH